MKGKRKEGGRYSVEREGRRDGWTGG